MKGRYVYIMGNRFGVLYIGSTNDLERRVYEHKKKLIKGFASRYSANRLLYFEFFERIEEAILWERRLKGWLRKRKLDLIREGNPEFKDLSEDWAID
ncbi:MAG: GIY-YIG nuclease family protein [Anaerolineales bacterium]|nr:GIY-YIG nuclease family protein [Anaerolineales bacterium]